MRTLGFTLAFLFNAGCGGSPDDSPPPEIQTPLEGVVFVGKASTGASVVVRDYAGGMRGDEVARAQTDDDGAWSADLGAVGGDLLVEVTTGEGLSMRSVATGVEIDVGAQLVVSPVTNLSEAYLRYLLRTGYDFDDAALKARRLFHLHFGRTDHHAIAPNDVAGGQEVTMLTPGVVSGILLASLVAVLEAHGAGSTSNALEALERDIESDGVFDGRASGARIGLELDSQTLRSEYGRAIRQFLASDENATTLRDADLFEIIDGVETSQSELFPSGVVEADEAGPIIAEFELLNGDGDTVDPTRGVRGLARITVRFEDGLGVDAAWIEDPAGGMLDDGSGAADTVSASIDTTAIADGEVPYALVATDRGGNESRMDLLLVVDNTPPVLDVTPPVIAPRSPITVTGTVADDTSGVDAVEVNAFGLPTFDDPAPSESFSVAVVAECDVVHDLEVVARDRAGNETRRRVSALCDEQAPAIQLGASPFFQEGGVAVSLHPSGGLSYSTASAEAATFSESTSWPIRIEKLYNRLDAGSGNLPTLRFLVSESLPAGTPSAVDVEYRYLVGGSETRPWTTLQRPASGAQYVLPLSYQALGPELATSGADALHRVEVRARDAAGNDTVRGFEFMMDVLSPPLFVTDCQVAPELSSHSLSIGNFDAMYQAGAATDVMSGTFRYLLDLPEGSLAPAAAVVVAPIDVDVRTRILELGEEKVQEATTHQFLVTSFQDIGNHCPFNTVGLPLTFAGVNDTTRVHDQAYVCAAGLYPDEGTFSTGLANDDAAHGAGLLMVDPSGAEILPQQGVLAVGADSPAELRVRMQSPVVTFGGIPFDWSTSTNAPPGYVPAQPAGPRYRTPLAAGLYRTGGERWDLGTTIGVLERYFETRSFVRRVEVATAPLGLSATHATLAGVNVPIKLVGACTESVVYVDQL